MNYKKRYNLVYKLIMKELVLSIFLVSIFCINSNCITDNFSKIINVMGVKKYNNQGYEINEEIYYKYNQIVYGSPELAINELTQRWKNVPNGNWIRNNKRGEYRLLGYNVIGNVVNNHEFPEDVIPSSTPENWIYKDLTDATNSWNNKQLYMYEIQKEYMKETNLIRNNIVYNLNCNMIGLNKTRVDNYATWKTKGVIYTNRIDPYGKVWEATFLTNPIGNDVQFDSYLRTYKTDYVMTRHKDYIDIPVNCKTSITNINKYITYGQVKLIETNIYANDLKVGTRNYTNVFATNNDIVIRIYRTMFEDVRDYQTVEVKIKLRSKLFTNFTTDLPFYSGDEETINILIQPWFIDSEGYMPPKDTPYHDILNEDEYIEPIYEYPKNTEEEFIDSTIIDLRKVVFENNTKYYEELNRTPSTNSANSQGFINAGNILGIRIKTNENVYKVEMKVNGDSSIKDFDIKTKKFEWDEPNKRGDSTRYQTLDEYEYSDVIVLKPNSDNTIYSYEYLIPYGTKQTLHSWNSIRELTGKSLDMDAQLLMNRVILPYNMEFNVYRLVAIIDDKGNTYTYTEIDNYNVYFDVFECWTNIYNRDITRYVLNKEKDKIDENIWENNL